MNINALNQIEKSKIKSSVFGMCIYRPSCALEIAKALYGNVKKYQDRNISKYLNELNRLGFVVVVDYNNWKDSQHPKGIKDYCKHNKAKHFYATDEIWLKLAKIYRRKIFGSRNFPRESMQLFNKITKNRMLALNLIIQHPALTKLKFEDMIKKKK